MYFEDLDFCQYHRGAHHAIDWRCPLRAIGWLEHPHPFTVGPVDEWVLDRVREFRARALFFVSERYMGYHCCSFCFDKVPELSYANIDESDTCLIVPGNDLVYCVPSGVDHYIKMHGYVPPGDFLEALRGSPLPGGAEYLDALKRANRGHEIPVVYGLRGSLEDYPG